MIILTSAFAQWVRALGNILSKMVHTNIANRSESKSSRRSLFLLTSQWCRLVASNTLLARHAFMRLICQKTSHILLIPKTIGNRKRDCAWGCAWGINTTWENLQIEKHKSVWWAERTPSWFVLFDLQIFSGGVYSPSATSHTIFFSISNSFWY